MCNCSNLAAVKRQAAHTGRVQRAEKRQKQLGLNGVGGGSKLDAGCIAPPHKISAQKDAASPIFRKLKIWQVSLRKKFHAGGFHGGGSL